MTCEVVGEEKDEDCDITDGVCEIGPIAAKRLGMGKVTQFRGCFLDSVSGKFFFAKGVAVVVPSLGSKVRMYRSCVKLWLPLDCTVPLGFDKGVQNFDAPFGRACISPQLAVA